MKVFSLKTQVEFDCVNRHGVKIKSRHFIIILLKNFLKICDLEYHSNDFLQNTMFLGMKVSKKFSKKAVVRNKVKRQIRHMARLSTDNALCKIDQAACVVIPRRGFDKAAFQELATTFMTHLENTL